MRPPPFPWWSRRIARPCFRPRLSLAEAPVPAAREASHRHACTSQEDGTGGFTVLCSVDRVAGAANVASADPREGVVVVSGPKTVIRLDLAASPGSTDARVIG